MSGDDVRDERIAALVRANAELEAELALVRSRQALLGSILENAPDFLAHVRVDGSFIFLNRVALGHSLDELAHKTIYDFTAPADHDQMRRAIARAVDTRQQTSFESVASGPDQAPSAYFTRVAPVLDGDSVTSVVLIATDVSRLKAAEAGLREAEATLLQVLSATGMGTWWSDAATGDGGCDAATARILDLGDERPTAEHVTARIHPDDRARVADSLAAAFATGSYQPIEHRVVHRDGSVHWVSANGRVVDRPDGSRRLVGGVIDVTARRALEAQLAQAQKMESVGRLAGGIAHDFNNMLTVILSCGEMARVALPPGSPALEDLAEVRLAAERSVALTTQLLAFARQQVIEPRVHDLNDVVFHVDKLLRRVLGEDVEVATALEAQAPVRIDPNQFEQVLLNLATNARDAMPDGGRLTIETADVELDASYAATHPEVTPGRYVMLAVSDDGTGVEPQLLGRLFEPFFTTKERGKGTGLGLATCYGIVKQNGGHIWVYSEPGRGTTFKIYLPAVTGTAERAVEVTPATTAAGHETVLVVEDEPMVRTLTVRTLTRAGYVVLAAENGVEALAVARAHRGPIHLLLTDVIMPHMGGRQLAELLRKERSDTAVLYVSGYTDNSVVHHGVLEPGVDFLQKPFMPAALTERVRQALDRQARR